MWAVLFIHYRWPVFWKLSFHPKVKTQYFSYLYFYTKFRFPFSVPSTVFVRDMFVSFSKEKKSYIKVVSFLCIGYLLCWFGACSGCWFSGYARCVIVIRNIFNPAKHLPQFRYNSNPSCIRFNSHHASKDLLLLPLDTNCLHYHS